MSERKIRLNTSLQLEKKPVFLVSGSAPGNGSTTLAETLRNRIQEATSQPVFYRSMGKMVRDKVGGDSEADMQRGLSEVVGLRHIDQELYTSLPDDTIVVVDGKLATTEGPRYIDPSRPIIAIDLEAPPLINAQRILRREGVTLEGDEDFTKRLIEYYHSVANRSEHDLGMRTESDREIHEGRITRFPFNSGRLAVPEMADEILEGKVRDTSPPEYETEALTQTYLKLIELRYRNEKTMRPEDIVHFDHQLESIRYGINRLESTTNSKGLSLIREDLRRSIVDCWYGIMMPKIPRFVWQRIEENRNQLIEDTDSQKWSPEFYKVAEGWPTIRAYLEDKTVLDPYAGPGAMMNLLVARGIVKRAIYSDLMYTDSHDGHRYDPHLNTEAGLLLFDNLPSWYKPDLSVIKGYIAADARELPIKDEAVDFVFGDPPYGKNHNGPGIGVLFGSLSELKRVSKEGAILMVPMNWIKEIQAAGHEVEKLTEDLSGGKSGLPVCYIHIKK